MNAVMNSYIFLLSSINSVEFNSNFYRFISNEFNSKNVSTIESNFENIPLIKCQSMNQLFFFKEIVHN
jgi:hypothetical protein